MDNIYLIGPMGAGKTTAGALVAKQKGTDFIDLDQHIKEKTGKTVTEIFDHYGEEVFRKVEKELFIGLTYRQDTVISTGGGLILDGFCRHLMRMTGHVFYLSVHLDAQLSRLEHVTDRPLLKQGDRADILKTLYETRKALYEDVADLIIDTSDSSPEEVANRILAFIPIED